MSPLRVTATHEHRNTHRLQTGAPGFAEHGDVRQPGRCSWCGRKLRWTRRTRDHVWCLGGYGDGYFCGLRCGYEFGLEMHDHGHRLKVVDR